MENFEIKGELGERTFRKFLDEIQVTYFWMEQTQETKAACMHGHAKRPDALIPLGHASVAAIDVKTKEPGFWLGSKMACVGVDKRDLKRLAQFELLSGIPAFLAFFDGWNFGRRDLWRIARLSKIQPVYQGDTYILLDINSLPLATTSDALMTELRKGCAQ